MTTPLAQHIKNEVGLKTAAQCSKVSNDLLLNANVTEETAKILFHKQLNAADAVKAARYWTNEDACNVIAQKDNRVKVLVELLQQNKAANSVIVKFMETTNTRLQKSVNLTQIIVDSYLDTLPIDFTDKWYETTERRYQLLFARRKNSKISNETVIADLLKNSHYKQTLGMFTYNTAKLLSARPEIVKPLLDVNPSFLEAAALSTGEETVLKLVGNKLIDEISLFVKESNNTNYYQFRNTLNVMSLFFENHPMVTNTLKNYVLSVFQNSKGELPAMPSRAENSYRRDILYKLHYSVAAIKQHNSLTAEEQTQKHLSKSVAMLTQTQGSNALMLAFIDKYGDLLTAPQVEKLTQKILSPQNYATRNVDGSMGLLLAKLQELPIDTASADKISKMIRIGYEKYFRDTCGTAYWGAKAVEGNVEKGKQFAQTVEVIGVHNPHQQLRTPSLYSDLCAYVDETLKDNVTLWQTLWELSGTFTGTYQELLDTTLALNQ